MIAKLLISTNLEDRKKEIENQLHSHIGSRNTDHPDILYFSADSKLGIEQARIIKKHFSLKPYLAKGRVVVLEDAANLTIESQNALLKTIEELPKQALLILGADSDANFLPTVLSRCQVIYVNNPGMSTYHIPGMGNEDIGKILNSNIQERFEYIEKLKDKEEFSQALVVYFHNQLISHPQGVTPEFIKELLEAEKWAKQNVNMRAILEYLMLVIPKAGK